jgi:GT2 family glycosyltransferase
LNKKVYIIILNYKGWLDTIECLESVFKLNYPNFQVIVVDNSPSEEPLKNLEKWASKKGFSDIKTSFPEIVYPLISKPISFKTISEIESKKQSRNEPLLIIKANKNLGFSAGNNIGLNYVIRRNDFDYCWLLNNDTLVENNSLSYQINYIEENEKLKIGILGSKLVYYHTPDKVQAVGGSLNTFSFNTKHIGEGESIINKKKQFGNIDYVVGASMFVSNKFLKEVGLLSEDYFLYYEELDWAFRAKSLGWEIDWCPKSKVYHKEGASIGSSNNYKKRSSMSEIEVFRSRNIFVKKYFKKRFLFYFSSCLIIFNRIRRFQINLALEFLKVLVKK